MTLQQRLYLQVSVDTPDTRLGIVADTCYATPINSISKKIKYDIIIDGLVLIVFVAHKTVFNQRSLYNVVCKIFKASFLQVKPIVIGHSHFPALAAGYVDLL